MAEYSKKARDRNKANAKLRPDGKGGMVDKDSKAETRSQRAIRLKNKAKSEKY